ncbi:MAG: DoxX family membrane protein [Winogradskyella sp.]|uniref:BT_3928 family protein n=1 Tax=Winogradskyella sp. TaxID=1883156 RepID=UPI0034588031|nr:DoxX family membrane protein [Winogradskyella sp.]
MKYITQISRIFVGVLFIISGFIKLNDPLGFSYKLEEYFSAEVLNMEFLIPYALIISVLVVVFEVVLGVFLLIGYKPKFTVYSLLAMIVFFTFLTFYSAYFEKVQDCGCFGDALKLTPWQSFGKDIILLVFILILVVGLKHIKPIFSALPTTVLALMSFIASLWFGYHVLMHLPAIDFRAYAVGKNIQEGMSTPENAAKPVIEYTYVFNVNGEEQEFVTNGSYPSVDGEFVDVTSKIIDEGYVPPIQDFSIESDEGDLTDEFLNTENLLVIAMYNINKSEAEGVAKLKNFTDEAIKKGYKVIGLTSSYIDAQDNVKQDYNLNFDFYLCDEKVIKTIVRSNPGAVLLNKGTVMNKAHWNDLDDFVLDELEIAKKESNVVVEDKLSFENESQFETNYERNLYRASEYYKNDLIIPDSILLSLVPDTQKDFSLYYGTTGPDHELGKTDFFYETTDLIFDKVIVENNDEFYVPSLKLSSFSDGEYAEGFTDKLKLIIQSNTERFCDSIRGKELANDILIKYYSDEIKCN